MDGFKKPAKMQCFKEGGSVKYESRKEHKEEMSADIAQDKAIVKKAISMHDKQEHKGEKTDLSKLKKGGRAKKEIGTARKFIKPAAAPSGAKGGPNKYKVGGTVSNVYEAKKKSGDLDAIEAVKNIKPGKADAPSKAAVISKNTPAKFCGGKSVKKYADGGSAFSGQGAISNAERATLTGGSAFSGQGALSNAERATLTGAGKAGQGAISELEKRRALEKMKRAMALDPAQQSELIKQSPAAAGLTPPPAPPMAPPMVPPKPPMAPPMGAGAPTPAPLPGGMKKGGKAKK